MNYGVGSPAVTRTYGPVMLSRRDTEDLEQIQALGRMILRSQWSALRGLSTCLHAVAVLAQRRLNFIIPDSKGMDAVTIEESLSFFLTCNLFSLWLSGSSGPHLDSVIGAFRFCLLSSPSLP